MKPWTYTILNARLPILQQYQIDTAIRAFRRAMEAGEATLKLERMVFAHESFTIAEQIDVIDKCLTALAEKHTFNVWFAITRTGENAFVATIRQRLFTKPLDDFEELVIDVDMPNMDTRMSSESEDMFDWFESEATNPGHVPTFNDEQVA